MPEKTKLREMTLSAIRKRFDYGSWDSADLVWLYTKAEHATELLEALEGMRKAFDAAHNHNQAIAQDIAGAAIRKARGE